MVPRRSVWVPLLIVSLGAVLRLVNLGSPDQIYFDETYYANDARVYLLGPAAYDHPLDEPGAAPPGQPPPHQGVLGEKSWVHPPLGKWLIAAGEAVLGTESPRGRRIVPALLGTATVLLVYLIGLELFGGSPGWAGLAALGAALDGLLIVQSRISMLDAVLAAFVCLGTWLLLRDRRALLSPATGGPARWCGSAWRVGAGLAFGAAISVKWSGALAVGAGAGLLLTWAAGQRRLREEMGGILVCLVALPAAVYLASYTGWFVQHGLSPSGFLRYQAAVADYHGTLGVTHAYQSDPIGWLLLRRPVAYYYDCKRGACTNGVGLVHHILALGNPGLWWPFLGAAGGLVVMAFFRARWEARVLLAFLVAQYVPWLAVGRPLFLFYMTPVVPFMALGLAAAARALPRTWGTVIGAAGATAIVVGALIWMPLWIGYGIDAAMWRRLMIFTSWY